MKLNYEKLSDYQKFWKDSQNLSQQKKDSLISLSSKFIQRVKDNDDELDGVMLLYPEDCLDFSVFSHFATLMKASVTVRRKGGCKIDNWFSFSDTKVG